jgi:hypothetical protein
MMIGTLGSVGSLVAATLYRWNDDRNHWFNRFISKKGQATQWPTETEEKGKKRSTQNYTEN